MAEEIDLNDEEEAALERAWEKLTPPAKCQCPPGQPCACDKTKEQP